MAFSAFESLTVSSTAVSFTAATEAGRNQAFITVETNAVRYRADGTDPSATVGHVLEVGDVLELEDRDEIDKTSFIARDAGDATLSISYGVGRK